MNASRVWIGCNGDVQANVNSDGIVTEVKSQLKLNLDDFFASVKNNALQSTDEI